MRQLCKQINHHHSLPKPTFKVGFLKPSWGVLFPNHYDQQQYLAQIKIHASNIHSSYQALCCLTSQIEQVSCMAIKALPSA